MMKNIGILNFSKKHHDQQSDNGTVCHGQKRDQEGGGKSCQNPDGMPTIGDKKTYEHAKEHHEFHHTFRPESISKFCGKDLMAFEWKRYKMLPVRRKE